MQAMTAQQSMGGGVSLEQQGQNIMQMVLMSSLMQGGKEGAPKKSIGEMMQPVYLQMAMQFSSFFVCRATKGAAEAICAPVL